MGIKEKINKKSPITTLGLYIFLGIAGSFIILFVDITSDTTIRILLVGVM